MMPSVIPVVPASQTVDPSRKPALIGDRVAALEAVMRRLAREATSRSVFIEQAFRRGGSNEFQLNDEVIRGTILPLLHEFFDRPQYGSAADQVIYEDVISRRNRDRLATSTTTVIDFLLEQNNTKHLRAFLERRPQHELASIKAYVQWKKLK
jgi:hypothetical protein